MGTILLSLLLLALSPFGGPAPDATPDAAAQRPLQFDRLDNGIELLVVREDRLPLVSVQLWYAAGAADEPANMPGIAAAARRALAPAPLPGHRHLTLVDATCFLRSGPAEDTAELVAQLAAIAGRAATISPAEITDVRDLAAPASDSSAHVADDVTLRADRRAASVSSEIRTALGRMLGDHPYSRVFRDVPDGADVTPEAVAAYVRRHFVPTRATVVVAGGVEVAATLTLLKESFAALEWVDPPQRRWPPVGRDDKVLRIETAGAVDRVTFVWLAPRAGASENLALDVLMQHLCNPVDGLLHAKLSAPDATLAWQRLAWAEAGALQLSVEPGASPSRGDGAQRLVKLEKTVQAALQTAAKAPPAPLALDRARALARRERWSSAARFADWAFSLGWGEVVVGDVRLALVGAEPVEQVWATDVQAAAAALARSPRVIIRGRRRVGHAGAAAPATRPADGGGRSAEESAPPVLRKRVDPAVTVTVRPAQTLRLIRVATRSDSGSAAPARELARLLAGTAMPLPPRDVRAYATYHGLDLRVVDGALVSLVEPAELERILELHANMMRAVTDGQDRAADEGPRYSVDIETPFSTADALAAAKLAWDSRSAEAE